MIKFRPRRERVTIEKRIERRNSVGEVLHGFERVCEIWAEIHGDQITARYFGECFPGWRVVIGADEFEIVGVIDRQGKTRLVELQIRNINDTGRGRFCPAGIDDEQQPPRAFFSARLTRAMGN